MSYATLRALMSSYNSSHQHSSVEGWVDGFLREWGGKEGLNDAFWRYYRINNFPRQILKMVERQRAKNADQTRLL